MNTIESEQNIHDRIVELLPRLRRFARNLARNAHDADDLVQTGLERALVHLDTWRRDARLDSWLFRIIRNAWIDEVRARTRRGRVLAPAEEGDDVGTEPMEQLIESQTIESVMARLPEEQRLAISLVLVEGLPYKEAAEVLEVPIGTLTSRLARGRDALQKLLSPAHGEDL